LGNDVFSEDKTAHMGIDFQPAEYSGIVTYLPQKWKIHSANPELSREVFDTEHACGYAVQWD
jgi:hypothetical protein